MKRFIKKGLVVSLIIMFFVLPSDQVHAESFEGKEEEYAKYCSVPREHQSEADFPVGIGTPIRAPINAIIVYSSNPYGSNSGYYPGNADG